MRDRYRLRDDNSPDMEKVMVYIREQDIKSPSKLRRYQKSMISVPIADMFTSQSTNITMTDASK
jgi:hypothetical protein